jgi:hypothetical protein
MRTVIIYRPNSEHGRVVEEYIHEFNKIHPEANLETFNVDSPEGSHTAELYGTMEYPAILALANDGQVQQQWVGNNLPLMNDLAYWSNQ